MPFRWATVCCHAFHCSSAYIVNVYIQRDSNSDGSGFSFRKLAVRLPKEFRLKEVGIRWGDKIILREKGQRTGAGVLDSSPFARRLPTRGSTGSPAASGKVSEWTRVSFLTQILSFTSVGGGPPDLARSEHLKLAEAAFSAFAAS
jgi:Antidote-toxin recognition MazE, bacterial antitoxin